jgi:hypothetical protein
VLGEKQRAGIMNEEVIKLAVKLKLTFVQQHLITQDVTRKEIKDVYVQFEKQQSPWSGWFQRKFLQKNVAYSWEDVINAINSSFQTRKMLKEMNATTISLIPKVANHTRLTDFYPIS